MNCDKNTASEKIADFIARYYSFSPLPSIPGKPECVDFVSGQYAITHLPLSDILPISMENYQYYTIPKLYTLLDTTNMEASGILKTLNQPSLGYKGRGTILGIIDTGIDYQNPLFINSDGTGRILGIWDQSLKGEGIAEEDPLPALHYGTEYTKAQIDAALQNEFPLTVVPSTDTNGHGTFLAAIAAGGELPTSPFTGAAPECFLAVVKLKPAKKYLRDYYFISPDAIAYQENDIMLGIKYLLTLSKEYMLPITILLGLGTNMGSHDGTAPLPSYMSAVSTSPGVVTVVAGGNETGFSHHYFGLISDSEPYDDVELKVAANEPGFTIELWAREPELYTLSFISPSGEQIPRVQDWSNKEHRLTFLLEKTVIFLDYQRAESETGSQLILMRFKDPAPGIWRIRVSNSLYIRGEYHMWLPIRGFISDETFFLRSNPNTTITEPGNAPLLITVAGYDHHDDSLYIHSSRGYTRQNVIKPDMAAPGVDVSVPDLPNLSGTSIAAAHVAGAAANILSWAFTGQNDPYMTTSSVKSFLVRGARRNPIFNYPNREWGYGIMDLYNSFIQLRG
ncbi:MAG: S8 family peptidase [Clostridium sp.]